MKPGPDPGHCGDVPSDSDLCDEAWGDSGSVLESQPDLDWDDTLQLDQDWTLDQDLLGSGPLERRWVLWQDFMKEQAQLDSWLQAAQQTLASSGAGPLTLASAREDLTRLEKLRHQAGPRLLQLDSLTRRNRTLTRLFQGSMQARLLALTRDCGLRWDDVSVRLEGAAHRLQLFLSEWEEFEAERAELAAWLADLNVHLTDMQLQTGSTGENLRRLQSFQQCVCVNSERVGELLRRGEALMQRSQAGDAQRAERLLLELLRSCSHVYNNIARTHTRLLSMRLVFEDDWILSRASDSGCPSESLLDDEAGLNLDLVSAAPDEVVKECRRRRPASPAPEHLGLEWDPSVDVGRSLTPDGADSSYFSTCTGLGHRDGLKRRSYLSSLGSWSDITDDITQEPSLSGFQQVQDPAPRPGLGPAEAWSTSTPERDPAELLGYGGRGVRAWLGGQSPAPSEEPTSCSKGVQTEPQVEVFLDSSDDDNLKMPRHRSDESRGLGPASSWSPDLAAMPDWGSQKPQVEEAESCGEEETDQQRSERAPPGLQAPPGLRPTSARLLLAAAAGLVLMLHLLWRLLETPCHRSNRVTHALHLTYINGPPPT